MLSQAKQSSFPSDSLETDINQLLENVFGEANWDGPASLAFVRAGITSDCELSQNSKA